MSRDRPTGAELLAIAGEVLRRDILPDAAADRRLAALMVLRCMDIAQRELADAGAGAAETARAAAALYGEDTAEPSGPGEGVLARLAADLRSGRFDAPERAAALHAVLLADAERRLGIANPKYLEAAGRTEGRGVSRPAVLR